MRVTQKLLFNNFMRDINKNRGEMGQIQSDLSSGKRVRMPSQGAVEFQRSRLIEESIRKEEQYQDNVNSGLRQGRMAQQALEETIDRLIDTKQILIHGATGSSNQEVRQTMATEIKGIRDSLVNTLNISSGERYLFAGTNSGERPFELDDLAIGGVQNNSNNTNPRILVGDGISLDISVSGTELRDTSSGDLFEILDNVINALENSDTDALNNLITDVDKSIEHVTNLTARIGTNINRMEFLFEQYESSKIAQKAEISNLVDTDYAQSFSDLQRNQIAYESAMAVHSTMFSNTLLNYL